MRGRGLAGGGVQGAQLGKYMKRFFYDNIYISGDLVLEGTEYNHLVNVMRIKPNEQVVICTGDGYDYVCEVAKISKKSAALAVVCKNKNMSELKTGLTLFQAIPKGDKMDSIVQKCTELGVKKIVPIITRYTTVALDTNKRERMKKIACESLKQCGGAVPIVIGEVFGFSDACAHFSRYDRVIMPYERELAGTIKGAMSGFLRGQTIALVIGSEGGFSEQEVLQAVGAGARLVTLGRRIFRADTAAICAAAAILYEAGEWEQA